VTSREKGDNWGGSPSPYRGEGWGEGGFASLTNAPRNDGGKAFLPRVMLKTKPTAHIMPERHS